MTAFLLVNRADLPDNNINSHGEVRASNVGRWPHFLFEGETFGDAP